MSSSYKTFLSIGLLVAFPGEFVNNFFIIKDFGNFLFAMVFYTVSLSIIYGVYVRTKQQITLSTYIGYALATGVVWGLFVNEWLLVGNHIGNTGTQSLIAQLSMVAYHSLVYTVPFVVIRHNAFQTWLPLVARRSALWFCTTILFGFYFSKQSTPDVLLAWVIFTTYFIGYLPIALYIHGRSIAELRKCPAGEVRAE